MRIAITAAVGLLAVATICCADAQQSAALVAPHEPALKTTAPVLWQPSMNVFRRFAAPQDKVFEFYGDVIGLKLLDTVNFNNAGTGVTRFELGSQQVKFTRRVDNRHYQPGGVRDATGLRLLTFFYADRAAITARFVAKGYPAPEFTPVVGTNRESALVLDPDGQSVELVVDPHATAQQLASIEVGLTVSDLERSRQFYRSFVGLEELPPVADARFGTTKYPFRHGSTTISLRTFGANLPADTGSGGIQYVVSNVDAVAALAAARHITVDQPLRNFANMSLRTIWLDDPDGITNYFAETGASRRARGD